MSDFQDKVTQFHKAFGLPAREHIEHPSDNEVRLRARLILEETREVLEAMFPDTDWREKLAEANNALDPHWGATPDVNIVELAHELADLHYVVSGTAVQFGFDEGAVFDEVHRANMAKVGGKVDALGKLHKPESWTPANVASVLNGRGSKP